MGLDFRKRSGRIADGSRLVVPGQITTGVKVFPNTFQYKQGSKNENLGPGLEIPQTPTPTPTNTPIPSITPTPIPSNTPTPTPSSPVETIVDAIITENDFYISIGDNEYLKY